MSEITLGDQLSEAFDQAEQNEPIAPAAPVETAESRVRDEKGRFAPKAEEPAKVETKPADVQPVDKPAEPAPVEEIKPPSSWKKEMWGAYQKLATGQALTPDEAKAVAKYAADREGQFASGVSTYKQEAAKARELQEAIAPFAQDLQTHGVNPASWVRQLGAAHQMLVRGTPEQKIQMFQKLAHDYGVPIQSVATGEMDPIAQHLTPLQQQMLELRSELNGWKQQQQLQEQSSMQKQIEGFASTHEHFEAVRETMAGLLQSGLASDLDSAYDKALRMNDDLWQAEQQRRATENAEKQRQEAAAKVARARANAVSPRSATPAGTSTANGKKDVRSVLEEQFDSMGGRV